MPSAPFDILAANTRVPLADPRVLSERPCLKRARDHASEAGLFVPDKELEVAINTALCVGDPLLITGDPGTGKTQTAYYVAWKLNLGGVLHFQVRSISTARDLLYSFDTVRYFQQAHLPLPPGTSPDGSVDKTKFRTPGPLWEAIDWARKRGHPRVVLIDEIDKAPRDFPNDLLHELDQMQIVCPDTGEELRAEPQHRPIVIITSNSERRLPEPFLRRCVFHHIEFNAKLLEKIVDERRAEFSSLSPGIRSLAIDKFIELRARGLRKDPSAAEFLVWLRVLATAGGIDEKSLRQADLSRLPYLGALVKDHGDRKDLGVGGLGN